MVKSGPMPQAELFARQPDKFEKYLKSRIG
jgi:ferredoxin